MKKNFIISTVIPIYNAEIYLEETIESVIKQTIGFEDNIQLILINDGSTDNSEEICKKYVEKFPDNVIYIYKENGGVAETKNYGIKEAKGEYINFLDADDILSEEALKNMHNFLEKNKEEIDMVAMPVVYFEKSNGLHSRYLRFNNQTGIVDLDKDPQGYVFSTVAMLYKRSVFTNVKFNTHLKIAEDLFLNTKLFIKKHKYGMMSANEAVYYYRKRFARDSITNSNEYQEDWLINVLVYLIKGIKEYCEKNNFKELPTFVKNIMIYNIVKRLKTPNFVDKKKLKKFYEISNKMLNEIEDDVIIQYQYDDYYLLAMMFMLKYNEYDIKKIIKIDNGNNLIIENNVIGNIENYSLQISGIKVVDKKLVVQGYFNDIITDDFKICYKTGKNIVEAKMEETDNIFLQKRFFDTIVGHTYQVNFELPFTNASYNIVLKNNETQSILALQNIYGDDGVFVNKEYTINKIKYNVKINNKKIYIKEIKD